MSDASVTLAVVRKTLYDFKFRVHLTDGISISYYRQIVLAGVFCCFFFAKCVDILLKF